MIDKSRIALVWIGSRSADDGLRVRVETTNISGMPGLRKSQECNIRNIARARRQLVQSSCESERLLRGATAI